MTANTCERVGLVLVHGIGEQRRFEHLNWQLQELLTGIRQLGLPLTVELGDGRSAGFLDEQTNWTGDENLSFVRVRIRTSAQHEVELNVHEVWWADINEPYSLLKQLKFATWALSVWAIYGDDADDQRALREMRRPTIDFWTKLKVKAELFLLAVFALLGLSTVGVLAAILQRLFDFDLGKLAPFRVFVTYISAIKIYNQRDRLGGDILDNMNMPPRVSIRRRVVRTITDVALAGYDRWFIVAHSLGTLVAHNGLMETGHALPNYLDRDRWHRLTRADMGGPAGNPEEWGSTAGMMPERPVWLADDEIVYRERLFAKFGGLITLGSPLNKLWAIWPTRVPVNKFAAIPDTAFWINIYDPLDPVSGVLRDDVLVPTNAGASYNHLLPDHQTR